MSIKHIEDLNTEKFIDVIENFQKFEVTEKIDGANLIFGFDIYGNFYTSRGGKDAKKCFSTPYYSSHSSNNPFINAHNALHGKLSILKSILRAGDAIEVEVLYGEQPNAIVYGSNRIIFLRGIVGPNSKEPLSDIIEKLTNTITGEYRTFNLISDTEDGISLKMIYEEINWKFDAVPKLDISFPNLSLEIMKLKELEEKSEIINMKLIIKEHLVDYLLRGTKSKLCDIDLDEHIGIEGIVLRDKETGEQVKIVDKKRFTEINQFNHAIRNKLKSGTKGRKDFDLLGYDGDTFNNMLEKINYTGNPGFDHLSSIKRTLRKIGETKNDILFSISKKLSKKCLTELKHDIETNINNHLIYLNNQLSKYKKSWESYDLILESGEKIQYNENINKRNLLYFAEIRKEFNEMLESTIKAETYTDVIFALYGKQLNSIYPDTRNSFKP